ncbi:MAG: DUF2723 domain-containing protein [Prevotellaceae bacterium]|jgi:hypothetical protein|nr:DUF2723 domain-containing protein [Prevotellaceae bacterium]
MRYKSLNNIIGWTVFVIAAFTYISTVEPTASLWDCSEFILSAYKLEVGHPPGAPLFMMVGHLFTLFSSPENVAFMVNVFSALCSAFTILFLFWSITHLVRRFMNKNMSELSASDTVMIMSCGVVGALAYTFSDTFWFSAVEGEVYAASSLMTALVFWAILKWEEQADSPYANRWLVLISYILGLSIGVHLLNLLVVPAIVFVYYFKKYDVTRKGIIRTSIISVVLLGTLVWGIIPAAPKVASWIELLFVNSLGLPINSGLLFFVILLTGVLAYVVLNTYRKKRIVMNTVMLCLSLCLLGYGSYAMIIIRSSANLPMDQNKPDNIFSLIKYLNRDQYGSRPLFTGPYFNTKDYEIKQEEKYIRLGNKYVKKDISQQVKYKNTTIFPRMWSSSRPDHVEVYKMYVKGKNPTFVDNIRFFIDYQMGFMYWRYFMWNFAGKQNDMQASIADPTKGNWISGIKPIDEYRLGNMDDMPIYLAENKGTNTYYFLPLLLGILGMLFHLKKDKKGFSLVSLLFFFTGMAVILYLNQTPNEPRERDYAYAASFYAFAIWIGMGVAFLYNLLCKTLKKNIAAPAAMILGLPIPAIMAQQNWDDHDRSGRYIATDFGYNYLNSCDENAVLYTFGDNDTFPLWYNQEVEGVRRDIKVANSMYLSSDWYYMQMMRRSHEAPPLATTATPAKIIGETRAYMPIEELRQNLHINQALQIAFDDNGRKLRGTSGIELFVFPAKNLILPINKAQVIEQGLALDTSAIAPYLHFKISGNSIGKNSLAALDFAANNFLKRPIYYGSSGNEPDFIMGIDGNLRQEGLARKLTPENATGMPIHIDRTFDLLVNKFRYRGINDPNVYMDETARRIVSHYRSAFFKLAEILKIRNDKEKLRLLMEKYHEAMPEMDVVNFHHTPYWGFANPAVEYYFSSELNEYGISLAQRLISEYGKEYRYYFGLNTKTSVDYELSRVYQGLASLVDILKRYNQTDLLKQADSLLKDARESMVGGS